MFPFAVSDLMFYKNKKCAAINESFAPVKMRKLSIIAATQIIIRTIIVFVR